MTDELRQAIKQYLIENLTVELDVRQEYYAAKVKITLFLDGDEVSSATDYVDLPQPSYNPNA